MVKKEKLDKNSNVKINYNTYLQIQNLLTLQKTRSPNEHDEMLFIITHQTYELWFKQIIHELDDLRSSFSNSVLHKIFADIKRIRHILKVLVLQVDILETMSPSSFLKFREYLGTASGFQSIQFRELEFLLGIKREHILNLYHIDSNEYKKLHTLYCQNSLWDCFVSFVKIGLNNINVILPPTKENLTEIQMLLLYIYNERSIYTEIAEALIDIDEGLQEWRYRHVKLVERTIGDELQGTGGSSGFEYLKKTIFLSFCPELWKIRNYFSLPSITL